MGAALGVALEVAMEAAPRAAFQVTLRRAFPVTSETTSKVAAREALPGALPGARRDALIGAARSALLYAPQDALNVASKVASESASGAASSIAFWDRPCHALQSCGVSPRWGGCRMPSYSRPSRGRGVRARLAALCQLTNFAVLRPRFTACADGRGDGRASVRCPVKSWRALSPASASGGRSRPRTSSHDSHVEILVDEDVAHWRRGCRPGRFKCVRRPRLWVLKRGRRRLGRGGGTVTASGRRLRP